MKTIDDNNKQVHEGNRPNCIMVCAMVRNEADIIESFCRHALAYADGLLITDHMSTDGTWEILGKLQGEGLPLYLWRSYEPGKHQAAVMTDLMKRAVNDYDADLVVLSDADEFLVSQKGGAGYVRQYLQGLPLLQRPGSYSLKMVNSEFSCIEESGAAFALDRPINREVVLSNVVKVLACRSAVEEYDLEVVEGNHGLMSGAKRRKGLIMIDVPYLPIEPEELSVLNLPMRSEGQFLSKTFCGWLSQVAQNTRFGYFAPQYKEVWESYLQGTWQMGKMESSRPADLTAYRGECQLKYTKGRVDPLANVMQVAEIFAEDYLREKVRDERPGLSVLLLIDKWDENSFWLKNTLMELRKQNYPIEQIFILAWRRELPEISRELAGQTAPGMILFAREAGTKLREVVQGAYVKWLMPGDEIFPGYLSRIMLLMQTNPMACVASAGTEIVMHPADADIDIWGWEWKLPAHHTAAAYWRHLFVRGGTHLPMCLASSVFRLDVMQMTNFLAGGLLANELGVFHNMSTWMAILDVVKKLEPSDGAVFWLREIMAKTEIIWDKSHQEMYGRDLEFVREHFQ